MKVRHNPTETMNHNRMYYWLIINNMKDEYIEIRKTKKMGRGIFAKQNIQPGTIIMIVKEQNFITFGRVKEHTIFMQIEQDIECKLSCFAYFLCFCENMKQECNQPQIRQYIKQLPQYFHNLICWTQQQLLLIQNQQLIKNIQYKQQYYTNKYEKIRMAIKQINQRKTMVADLPQPSKRNKRIVNNQPRKQREKISSVQMRAIQKITLEQFFKFIAIIKSRNIYWVSEHDKSSEVGALIPYLQLFNHSSKSQCKVQQFFEGQKVTTIKEIKKDQEVFVMYADLSIQLCLEDYGMIDLTAEFISQEQHQPLEKEQPINLIHSQRRELANKYNRYHITNTSPLKH